MVENENNLNSHVLIGAWLIAIGTIVAAIAEVRELVGLNEVNNKLVAIGEGIQAVGAMLGGLETIDDPLNFVGDWIDGAGAATSSYAAYLQDKDEESDEDTARLEILGASLQSMGASMSAVADKLAGEDILSFGNVMQGFGAGLEAIGGIYDLNEKENEGQPIITIGAIIQALGANLNAVVITKDLIKENKQ
ncbi:hypothetical protein BKP37_15400 [Anaerobacillus alkalilacustris]|uniref:Uncharacterized protein n=1 Tax=Anaerobacillus alkalilacustris TaxID=393763 RepID=A0A1S2LH27_9BACI|nr:hypothetical protein [Anaerobacillus alkalilacustris]OIJ11822.1 hypothetical protein BKP37_15400 [Anaerobacillus alkalilacustris]